MRLRKSSFSFVLLCLLLGCSSQINLTGDIKTPRKIKNIKQLINVCREENSNEVAVLSSDTTGAVFSVEALSLLYLTKNSLKQKTDYLPPTVCINHIKEIVLMKQKAKIQTSFFDGINSQSLFSSSDLRLFNWQEIGNSEKNGFKVRKLRSHKRDIGFLIKSPQALMITEKGREYPINTSEWLSSRRNMLIGDSIKVIWSNYPSRSVYDVYARILALQSQKKLLCIFVDGLGYRLWDNYRNREIDTIADSFHFEPMRSCYPPQTKYVYHVFGTGEHLNQNRHSVIFSGLKGVDGVVIEEKRTYYTPEVELILNADTSGVDQSDDEIYHTALTEIEKDKSFVFVHFHTIDEYAHANGPYHPKVTEQITKILKFVDELKNKWDGNIMIISDHGLHPVQRTGTMGYHGDPVLEDMAGVYEEIIRN